MKNASPETLLAYEAACPVDPRVERKKMFGKPGAFIQGNLFMGVMGDTIIFRMSPQMQAAAKANGAIDALTPRGSVWKDYVAAEVDDVSDEQMKQWGLDALEHTAAMPPK